MNDLRPTYIFANFSVWTKDISAEFVFTEVSSQFSSANKLVFDTESLCLWHVGLRSRFIACASQPHWNHLLSKIVNACANKITTITNTIIIIHSLCVLFICFPYAWVTILCVLSICSIRPK